MIDATHHPALQSWVSGANGFDADFPIQNLPFGRFRRAQSDGTWCVGVAIGDQILDLRESLYAIKWPSHVGGILELFANGNLNAFMAAGSAARKDLRAALSKALRLGSGREEALGACLVAQASADLGLPCEIGDYTDFFTGIHHATAAGRLFRPNSPLLPNYKWVPIGYHGRASSLVPSGTSVVRPHGQVMAAGVETPRFAPTARLDYELELGFLVGKGNVLGERVSIEDAEQHLFGVTLLNDWSARDIQSWEYQPLGPFLGKSFATTLSPWIVTLEALAPFRAPLHRPKDDPQPLAYLSSAQTWKAGAVAIALEAWLQTSDMQRRQQPALRLSHSSAEQAAYWTPAQLLVHHTSNGCNLRPGDLIGSGTLSGPDPEGAGSLLELSVGGQTPLRLANGETRAFLQDGDTLTLRAHCERPGARRIGFGPCTGTVLPAA